MVERLTPSWRAASETLPWHWASSCSSACAAGSLVLWARVAVQGGVDTNAVFVRLSRRAAEKLREKFFFYTWDEAGDAEAPLYRWMTSFDTTAADVDEFATALRDALSAA